VTSEIFPASAWLRNSLKDSSVCGTVVPARKRYATKARTMMTSQKMMFFARVFKLTPDVAGKYNPFGRAFQRREGGDLPGVP